METELIELDREDVILMILEANERLFRRKTLSGITRLEKLLFLLEKETDFEGIGDFFTFVAHNFGPFSKEVYEAVEFLSSCELIKVSEKAYPSFYASSDEAKLLSEISESDVSESLTDVGELQVTEKLFGLTDNGRKVAKLLRASVEHYKKSDVEALDGIVRRYATWPLNQLIRYVYRQHPEMTVNSIHPEAKKLPHAH